MCIFSEFLMIAQAERIEGMHGQQRANFARSIQVDEQSPPETPPHVAGPALIEIALTISQRNRGHASIRIISSKI